MYYLSKRGKDRGREKEREKKRGRERERNSPIKVFLFIVNLTCCMYVKFTDTGTIHGAIN